MRKSVSRSRYVSYTIQEKNKHCFTVLLARFYICFLFQRIPHAVINIPHANMQITQLSASRLLDLSVCN